MAKLRTVGIRELKSRMSEYLREVRLGTTVLVTDRGTVIAEIREPGAPVAPLVRSSLLASWVEQGRVRQPLASKSRVGPTSVHVPNGVSRLLLDEERGG